MKDLFGKDIGTRHRKVKFKTITPRKNIFQKNAYRPESVVLRARKNSSLLDEIRQKPISHGKRSSHSNDNIYKKNNWAVKKLKSFSLSMPLIPALCVLFLGIFLVIRHQDSITSLMRHDVVPAVSLEDTAGRINTISYAGVNQTDNATPSLIVGLESIREVTEDRGFFEIENNIGSGGLGENIPGEEVISAELTDAPIPLRMAEYFSWEHYVVRRGDSVSGIAAEHGLSYDAIITSNDLTNANLLRVGQVLRIPNMNGIPYVVRQGDTLSNIARNWNIPLEVIVDVNNIQADILSVGQTIFLPGARMPVRDLRLALGSLFTHPLRGGAGVRFTSGFGWRPDPFTGVQSLHQAVDWAAPIGTAVRAASDGRVAMVGTDPGYGRYIILSHSDNFETLYAHLSSVSVRQGDRVTQGVKIGEVGNTGRSTGPHLHFALYRSQRAVNPLDYLAL